MEYHSDRFKDQSLMFYYRDELVALLPLNRVGCTLYSHGGLTYGGFIVNETMKQELMLRCFDALVEYSHNIGCNHLIYKTIPHIYHLEPAEEDIFALHYTGAKFVKAEASTVINLKEPFRMAKLRHRQILKAQKQNIIVDIATDKETYYEFMKLQDQILIEHHNLHAVHTGEELYLLYTRFPESIHLYVAKLEGRLIAGTVVFEYPKVVHTQYLAANDEARKVGALDLVIARVMEDYSSIKNWLDFGISTENDGHYLNTGLISQKEGFGGRTNVYETWEILFEP